VGTSWSKVEGLDNPNPTEVHRGGRPGRSATLRQALRYAPRALSPLHHHPGHDHKLRNVIERTFCRIKDFRGIATRYDKTARDFLAAVCLVSAITYWA
jgi:hypothetical protein